MSDTAVRVIRGLMQQGVHLCEGSRILVYDHDRDVGTSGAIKVPEGIIEPRAIAAVELALTLPN